MRCKLGKQAIVDAVLDYLERKYALSTAHDVPPLERLMRLRERVQCEPADKALSTAIIVWDDFPNWFDDPS